MLKVSVALGAMGVAAVAAPARADAFNDLTAWKGAVGSYTLVNFDEDPDGRKISGPDVPIGSIYGAWGLDFPPANRIFGFFGGPVSPPNGWLNDTDLGGGEKLFDVNIMDGFDITAVGVHNVFFGSWPSGATLSAYGAGGKFLGSSDSNGIESTLDFFGVTTTEPIKRVEIIVHAAGGWGLDDLYIGQVIPAPGVGAILGIVALGAARRRR